MPSNKELPTTSEEQQPSFQISLSNALGLGVDPFSQALRDYGITDTLQSQNSESHY